jgi:hypothetical protein
VFTPVGSNIGVSPADPTSGISVDMVFQNVTESGISSVTTSTSGPVPPTGFKLGDPPTYYDISTSAVFTGYIDICIDYSGINFKNNGNVKIFHFDGSSWVDVTISRDAVNKIVCGRVTSLSPFALFEDDGFEFSGFFSPVDNPPVLNVVKAGSSVPVKFSLNGNQGLNIFPSGYPKVQVIACSSAAIKDKLEETAKAGASVLSYNAVLDQYTYVWKTNKNWAGTCRQLEIKLVDGTSHFANFNFTR